MIKTTPADRIRASAKEVIDKLACNPDMAFTVDKLRRLLRSSTASSIENRRVNAVVRKLATKYNIPREDLA